MSNAFMRRRTAHALVLAEREGGLVLSYAFMRRRTARALVLTGRECGLVLSYADGAQEVNVDLL